VQTIDCDLIEQHVRQVHLGRTAARSHDEDTDHEEEFYYTEFDIPEQEEEDEDEEDPEGSLVVEESRHEEDDNDDDDEDETMTAATAEAGGSSVSATTPASQLVSMTNPYCQAPTAAFAAGTVETLVPLLADHCDMARPPHENPEYAAAAAHQQGIFLPFFSSLLSRLLFPRVHSFRRITCKSRDSYGDSLLFHRLDAAEPVFIERGLRSQFSLATGTCAINNTPCQV
jgi:hypothetical protein